MDELKKKYCPVEVPNRKYYVGIHKKAHDTQEEEGKQNVVKTETQIVWYQTAMKKISKFPQYLSRWQCMEKKMDRTNKNHMFRQIKLNQIAHIRR